MPRWLRILLLLGLCLYPASSARAILIIGPSAQNNGTPGQNLINQNFPDPFGLMPYIGSFGGVPGIPISPDYFVTVTHAGNWGGGFFSFANNTSTSQTYPVVLAGTSSDLALWRIDPNRPDLSFSYWAPLYTSSDELGKPLVTIGPGTQRGAELTLPGYGLRGWQWGAGGLGFSWGRNTVEDIPDLAQYGYPGTFLWFGFDNNPLNPLNADEGIYSTGDSGGPTFIQDPADNVWKLTGLNSLVDGINNQYNQVQGAIFDARGYIDDQGNVIGGPVPVPFGSYAVRISSRISFLDDFITFPIPAPSPVPEPSTLVLTGVAAMGVAWRYWRRRGSRIATDHQPSRIAT